MPKRGRRTEGRPLGLDPRAESTDPSLPAFLSRPLGAPVYHGFPILEDVEVDGFVFGMISDIEAAPDMTEGDAFVVAPDSSRAGLVWEVASQNYFQEVRGFEPHRWGVWAVAFPHPMSTRDNARLNLEAILPQLKEKWEAWREQYHPNTTGEDSG
jgi:hypothetical protein